MPRAKLQHFALNSEGELVSIEEAHERGGNYFCPFCKGKLMVKWGNGKRTPHFAHYPDADCDYDRYLHSLAEMKICEWFNNSNEIIIEPETEILHECEELNSCYSLIKGERCRYTDIYNSTQVKYNLKQWYHNAELEKSYTKNGKNYVADILCPCKIPGKDPLFIEIYVTHKCTEEKEKSGLKILELKIGSEEDIDKFINGEVPLKYNGHYKSETSYKFIESTVKFYGFNPKPLIEYEKQRWRAFKFVLQDNGKWRLFPVECKKILVHKAMYEITFAEDVNWGALIARAIEQGYSPQQHMLCKYYGDDYGRGRICKTYKHCNLKKYCKDNKLPCQYYALDEQLYKSMLEEYYNLLKRGEIIEEWKRLT